MSSEAEYVGGLHVTQLTPDICLRLVQGNGNLLLRIPLKFRTNEIKLAAVKCAPNIIMTLDSNEITDEMYHIAVKKNRKLVKYVPDNVKSYIEYLIQWKNKDITYAVIF